MYQRIYSVYTDRLEEQNLSLNCKNDTASITRTHKDYSSIHHLTKRAKHTPHCEVYLHVVNLFRGPREYEGIRQFRLPYPPEVTSVIDKCVYN